MEMVIEWSGIEVDRTVTLLVHCYLFTYYICIPYYKTIKRKLSMCNRGFKTQQYYCDTTNLPYMFVELWQSDWLSVDESQVENVWKLTSVAVGQGNTRQERALSCVGQYTLRTGLNRAGTIRGGRRLL